jgi:hypothetical protein
MHSNILGLTHKILEANPFYAENLRQRAEHVAKTIDAHILETPR